MASDLGLCCIHMSHKKDARLIRVNKIAHLIINFVFFNQNMCCGYSKEPSQQWGV